MKFAYADPPYHGMGKKMYGPLHDEAGIWDNQQSHLDLVIRLQDEYSDGWALSCNPRDLSWILPHCPKDCRVGAWTKTYHQIRPTGTQFAWEPVIWRTIKKSPKRMIRDWISGPNNRGSDTPGAKPHYFNRWILELLVFDHETDTLDDLFPGSGGMSKALTEIKLL
jgi:hypothetical protein